MSIFRRIGEDLKEGLAKVPVLVMSRVKDW